MDATGPVTIEATPASLMRSTNTKSRRPSKSPTPMPTASASFAQSRHSRRLYVRRQPGQARDRSRPSRLRSAGTAASGASRQRHASLRQQLAQRQLAGIIRNRRAPICDAEIGHRSATVCHLGNIACRVGVGLRLTWDPAKEEFVGNAAAQAMVRRTYRAPGCCRWKVECTVIDHGRCGLRSLERQAAARHALGRVGGGGRYTLRHAGDHIHEYSHHANLRRPSVADPVPVAFRRWRTAIA